MKAHISKDECEKRLAEVFLKMDSLTEEVIRVWDVIEDFVWNMEGADNEFRKTGKEQSRHSEKAKSARFKMDMRKFVNKFYFEEEKGGDEG